MIDDISSLLDTLVEANASDMHLSAGVRPYVRIHGRLEPSAKCPEPISADEMEAITSALLGEKRHADFRKTGECDMAMNLEGGRRIRINAYRQLGRTSLAIRLLPSEFFPLEKLGVPMDICSMVCAMQKGLVLVTGATGSGKTTTLASLLNKINIERECHMFTIEDPIEYVHTPIKAFVSQREVGHDTASFHEALRRVLRQDPDVVMIGEMRDNETMRAALTLAETGHLTLATMHSSGAVHTISRIVGSFPSNEQDLVRTQLAGSLSLVISQQLVPWDDGEGRSLAVEILLATPAVKALIRENKIHQIPSAIQTGSTLGMKTMGSSLAEMVASGEISRETAQAWSIEKDELRNSMG